MTRCGQHWARLTLKAGRREVHERTGWSPPLSSGPDRIMSELTGDGRGELVRYFALPVSAAAFSAVLLDVVTIADEVDSQLKQALSSFVSPKTVLKPLMVGREEHSFSTNTRSVSDLAE
jgi:hypothetical protein